MAKSAVGIIFSSLNNKTLSRLTSDRTVAAIPFACRYRLVDFALSNMVNANISNINIVANYNYRSLQEHIGSGKDWDLARRRSGINFISPFQTAVGAEAKMFSTHMEALKSMKEYIDEFSEEFVVLSDSDTVLNIDLSRVIEYHEKSGCDITMVTKTIDAAFSSKHPRMLISSQDGKIVDIALGQSYNGKQNELALGIFVMKTLYLKKIIEEAEAYNLNSFTSLLLRNSGIYDLRAYNFTGYVASVSSFLDYYKCSIELAKNEDARESLLWKKDFPVFTRVNNSSPTKFTETATVKSSMIADDCVIEGTVINSVISRGVRVEKGAVVKNSVLFKGTRVGRGASLNCIVCDINVDVSENIVLSGNDNMPFYIQKGRKV